RPEPVVTSEPPPSAPDTATETRPTTMTARPLLPLSAAPGPAPSGAGPSAARPDYVLGEDDEIEISVYGNTDLVKTQTVRPGGYIAFPLVGTLRPGGLSPEELRQQI